MKNRITFLGIGTAKGGTTSLYDILRQHPEIHLPEYKEVHFFDYTENFKKGIDWYEKMAFSKVMPNVKAIGEITPCYMYSTLAAQRIFDTLGGDVKIIVILRNPADRAFSHFNMLRARGIEKLTFKNGINIENERLESSERNYFRYGYIARGLYAKQLSEYYKLFNKERIKVVLFDDFLENKRKVVSELLSFLEVDASYIDKMNVDIKSNDAGVAKSRFLDSLIYNDGIKRVMKAIMSNDRVRAGLKRKIKFLNRKKGKSSVLTNELRVELTQNYFMEDIKDLEVIINKNLTSWYV